MSFGKCINSYNQHPNQDMINFQKVPSCPLPVLEFPIIKIIYIYNIYTYIYSKASSSQLKAFFEIHMLCMSIILWFLFLNDILSYGCYSIYFSNFLLMDIWVISNLRLLNIIWTSWSKSFCGCTLLFILGKNLRMDFWVLG